MIEIVRIPPGLAAPAWRDVAPWLAPAIALAEGRHTLATTLERVQSGKMVGYVALSDAKPIMACIAQVALYPAEKWLQVPFCGGRDMRFWLEPLVDEIDSLAYNQHCVGVEISGRGGWARVLRQFGYRPSAHHNLLCKRLDWQHARKAAE